MPQIDEFIRATVREIDAELNQLLPAETVEPTNLHQAMRWAVFPGGKRIRPVLLAAVAQTFGPSVAARARTGAAFELIHSYSLVHDDLPSMDDDDLRRGRETVHKKFGEATAVLAGDALQALAFQAIAGDEDLEANIRIRIIGLLAEASGTPDGMVAGQQRDLNGEGGDLPISEIETIHRQKTGALITAAALSGAMIGGAPEKDLVAIKLFAENLGLLFQITDDLLDATGETNELGKTAGKDAAAGKSTYPRFYGVEATLNLAKETAAAALKALSDLSHDTTLLKELVHRVASRTT
jgi:geranylgeranyl pyrophosphate synthase